MTVIATASNPNFVVSRADIDRPGITYTIDTLRDGMMNELRGAIQEDDELLERLTAIVEGVARREAAKE